jgi:hypothetical protein
MTKTTQKTTSIYITKENLRQLTELCDKLGENQSQVLMRGLQNLYNKYIEDKK